MTAVGFDINTLLDFKSFKEWHDWLVRNHNFEAQAWVLIRKKNSKQTGLRYEESLEEALCFGWIDGKMQSIDKDTFILRYTPRKSGSVWSRRNREKAERLIAQGKMTESGLAKIDEAKENGFWDSAYINLMRDVTPADLESALKENPTAWSNFNAFANSYRNIYIGWINTARTEQTRNKRINEVVKRSILNKKPGTE